MRFTTYYVCLHVLVEERRAVNNHNDARGSLCRCRAGRAQAPPAWGVCLIVCSDSVLCAPGRTN